MFKPWTIWETSILMENWPLNIWAKHMNIFWKPLKTDLDMVHTVADSYSWKGLPIFPGTLKKDFPCSAWRLSRITKRQPGTWLDITIRWKPKRTIAKRWTTTCNTSNTIPKTPIHCFISDWFTNRDWEFRSISTSPVEIMNELPNKTKPAWHTTSWEEPTWMTKKPRATNEKPCTISKKLSNWATRMQCSESATTSTTVKEDYRSTYLGKSNCSPKPPNAETIKPRIGWDYYSKITKVEWLKISNYPSNTSN